LLQSVGSLTYLSHTELSLGAVYALEGLMARLLY